MAWRAPFEASPSMKCLLQRRAVSGSKSRVHLRMRRNQRARRRPMSVVTPSSAPITGTGKKEHGVAEASAAPFAGAWFSQVGMQHLFSPPDMAAFGRTAGAAGRKGRVARFSCRIAALLLVVMLLFMMVAKSGRSGAHVRRDLCRSAAAALAPGLLFELLHNRHVTHLSFHFPLHNIFSDVHLLSKKIKIHKLFRNIVRVGKNKTW